MHKMTNLNRKAVTVSLKADLFNEYKKYCDQYGMFISRRVEILLEKDLNELKKFRLKSYNERRRTRDS